MRVGNVYQLFWNNKILIVNNDVMEESVYIWIIGKTIVLKKDMCRDFR